VCAVLTHRAVGVLGSEWHPRVLGTVLRKCVLCNECVRSAAFVSYVVLRGLPFDCFSHDCVPALNTVSRSGASSSGSATGNSGAFKTRASNDPIVLNTPTRGSTRGGVIYTLCGLLLLLLLGVELCDFLYYVIVSAPPGGSGYSSSASLYAMEAGYPGSGAVSSGNLANTSGGVVGAPGPVNAAGR
jgi:hypothetical protein